MEVQLLEWAIPLVDAADSKFVEKTSPDNGGLIWGAYLAPHAWWNRRVPNNDALVEDLRVNGADRRKASYRTT